MGSFCLSVCLPVFCLLVVLVLVLVLQLVLLLLSDGMNLALPRAPTHPCPRCLECVSYTCWRTEAIAGVWSGFIEFRGRTPLEESGV